MGDCLYIYIPSVALRSQEETDLTSSISIQPIKRPHQAEPTEKRSYNRDYHSALFLLQGPSKNQSRHRQHAK